MICFIIKYSSRNDDFERELSQMLYIFNSYTSNITIIISKSEKVSSKTKEEIKSKGEKLQREKIKNEQKKKGCC